MPVETILLIAIVALLVVIAILLYRFTKRQQVVKYELTLDPRFTKQVDGLGAKVRQYADISAVLGIMDQLTEHPDAIERLREFPEAVRAACWIHYIDRLGGDLQNAQKVLSNEHQRDATYLVGGETTKRSNIKEAQQHVDSIRTKLDAAIAASGQPVGPRAA